MSHVNDEYVLQVEDLTVYYEMEEETVKAVNNISFSLKKGETIVVTVESDYEMTTTEGATLAYTITKDDADLVDSIVAVFGTDKAEQTSTIHIAASNPDYAGEYKDTVAFTIEVKSN